MGFAKKTAQERAENYRRVAKLLYGLCYQCGEAVDYDPEGIEGLLNVDFLKMSEEEVVKLRWNPEVQSRLGNHRLCSYCQHIVGKDD